MMLSRETQDLAQRLLDYEAAAGGSTESKKSAVIRVCEKLRRPLTTLAGAAGFHSLLLRALTLAKREAPSLGALQVNAAGSLEDVDPNLYNQDAEGGTLLVAHLIELLFTDHRGKIILSIAVFMLVAGFALMNSMITRASR